MAVAWKTSGITPAQVRRESGKARRERAAAILARLRSEYPDSRCSLDFQNPLQTGMPGLYRGRAVPVGRGLE